ncbi:MAG: stage sporulation protein [Acidimicrobiia bacterium]|nr:stage sporulation protein [Acidimicrobiia bacterium]
MVALLRQDRSLEVSVVGAGALNQAIKAVAIARPQLIPENIDIVLIPTFVLIDIEGVQRTALCLHIEHRLPEVVDLSESTAGVLARDVHGGLEPGGTDLGRTGRGDVPWTS